MIMNRNFDVRANYNFMWDDFDIAIFQKAINGDVSIVQPFSFAPYQIRDKFSPTIESGNGGREFLQSALDAAWECGLRPAGFNDVKEQVKALGAHLEDMRSIAFHKVGAPKP